MDFQIKEIDWSEFLDNYPAFPLLNTKLFVH